MKDIDKKKKKDTNKISCTLSDIAVNTSISKFERVKFIGCYGASALKSSQNVCEMDMSGRCRRYLEFFGAFLQ